MARPKGTKKQGLSYLNEAQLRAFTTALEKHGNLRDQCMMALTLYLGLRAQELVNIQLKDIGFDSHQITIQGLKSGRRRTYSDLDEKLWKKLCQYVKREKPSQQLFPVTVQTAKNAFKRFASLAGLSPSFSIHALRHTCAMLQAKRGDSPIRIMLWLRHRSLHSTQRYVEQTLFEKDSDRMNELMAIYL
jgi:integrase